MLYRESQALDRARLRRRYTLTEHDRAFRIVWCELNNTEIIAFREIGIESPTELFVERLRNIDIRNAEHHDLELHVDRFNFSVFCRFHNSSSDSSSLVAYWRAEMLVW